MARSRKPKNRSTSQTLTAVGKIVNLSDQNALLLGLLGFVATKVWNLANHHRRSLWEAIGKIPGFIQQCKELKFNRWYKLLPSQSAQEVLGEQDDSYRSWFSHRKNGNAKANPPGFRRKDSLSTVTFKQNAFEILPENRIKLILPKTYNRRNLILEYRLAPDVILGKVRQVKLVYLPKTGDWMAHLTHIIPVEYRSQGSVMALDLGIINIIAGVISSGFSFLVPGGELLALDRYFQQEKAKCRSSKSRRCRELNRKWSRQRNHYLHVLTKWLVNLAVAQNVSVIVVGELKGIRTDKDWGEKCNQKLHAWPFEKIVKLLTYKAALTGIRVVKASERNTSTTCIVCGKRAKGARVKRGLFVHCNQTFNADIVGAFNILQMYLRQALATASASGVVGVLARPAVNLFVWRKTTPLGREQGTFKRAA
jgi:putative transposase